MTTKPKSQIPSSKSQNPERGGARRMYVLSLWSPLLLIGLSCLGPAVFLLPLLILYLLFSGFRSPHAFVRWHTGQWTALTLPVIGLFAFLSISYFSFGDYSDSFGLVCFGLVFASGWYLGNVIGLRQANQGRCWLWKWLVPAAELPRPWAVPTPAVPTAGASAAMAPATHTSPASAVSFNLPADPYTTFERGQSLSNTDRRAEVVACFLSAFRSGSAELRQRAVAELEKVGEVETF